MSHERDRDPAPPVAIPREPAAGSRPKPDHRHREHPDPRTQQPSPR